jgi:mono/diheme cytochrome c family protein
VKPGAHVKWIVVVTLAVTGYYTYIGQMVPQKEVHPPKAVMLSETMSTDEMVEVGKTLFEGKGTCTSCHKLSGGSGRFPDLGSVGSVAATRKPGVDDIGYLAEALLRPGDFIVPGFSPGMPNVDKAPMNLTDMEIKTVIAYLQSLGGSPSITMDTTLAWQSQAASATSKGGTP